MEILYGTLQCKAEKARPWGTGIPNAITADHADAARPWDSEALGFSALERGPKGFQRTKNPPKP